ncbi:YciI family protein [Asanoa sp. NPDC049573]|uniref:YciI family protein n=1 Tax=Asanoa sp. NPDC049573 TaxID=3155396 RepID=UPI00341B04E3
MTQYAILLYTPAPADFADLPVEEQEAHMRHEADVEALGGRIVKGYALHSSSTATSVRGDTVTDGPFIEAKEVIAGFYILEARDLDHALEISKLNPATWRGGVEIRPLLG